LLKKKAAINKAPLLGVVDARFPVIAHHRCAHDSPHTVWAPHRAYQYGRAGMGNFNQKRIRTSHPGIIPGTVRCAQLSGNKKGPGRMGT
jgi:hypothetical protein